MNACSFIYWHWNSSAFIVAIVLKDKDSNYIIEWPPLKKARISLRLPSTIELFSNTGADQIAIHFVPLHFQKEYFLMFNIKKKWKIWFHLQLLLGAIDHYSMKEKLDALILFWIGHKLFYVEVYQISKSLDQNFPLLC